MEILEERFGKILVEIVNSDRATLNEAARFKPTINQRIDEGFRYFIIDLSDCDFIDSTFLGVLVHSLKRIRRREGQMRLIGFKPPVKSMFELTRMDKVFKIHETVEEALSQIQNEENI